MQTRTTNAGCVKRWKTAKLGDIAELKYGRSLSATQRRGGAIPVYGSNGVVGYHDKPLISGPGIVIGRKGAAGSVTWINVDFWPIDTTYYVDCKVEWDIDFRWLYYTISMLQLENFKEGPIPGLNRHTVGKLAVSVPPLHEQRKIAEILYSIDDAIEKTQEVIDEVQVVKRGLLEKLLTPTSQNDTTSSWRSVRLGEVVDERTATFRPSMDDRRPYVGLEHLAQGTPTILGWRESKEARSAKKSFRKGDVLFGKLRPELRKAALAPFDGACSTDIIPLCCKHGIEQGYLVQLAHGVRMQSHAIANSSGTKMPRTSWEQLREFTFELPPVEVQKEIVAVLSSVDHTKEANEALSRRLSTLKRSLMSVLLTGELRVTTASLQHTGRGIGRGLPLGETKGLSRRPTEVA